MALSPHLGVDENVQGFLDLMIRQIATSTAAVLLFEDEVRHREHVAQQLDLRTKELTNSELKFQQMAENSLVGIVTADPQGTIMYANHAFYDITGHDGKHKTMQSWLDLFPEEVVASLTTVWSQLHTSREATSVEYPLKKPWKRVLASGEVLKGRTWILISAFVEEEEDDGSIKSSLATMTDISQQKWAEEHQKRRMEEAMVCHPSHGQWNDPNNTRN
jgi:PAS domain S-box-containing protein